MYAGDVGGAINAADVGADELLALLGETAEKPGGEEATDAQEGSNIKGGEMDEDEEDVVETGNPKQKATISVDDEEKATGTVKQAGNKAGGSAAEEGHKAPPSAPLTSAVAAAGAVTATAAVLAEGLASVAVASPPAEAGVPSSQASSSNLESSPGNGAGTTDRSKGDWCEVSPEADEAEDAAVTTLKSDAIAPGKLQVKQVLSWTQF